MKIEGKDFTLFADYDKLKLPGLSYSGRVTWFENRVKLILLEPLKRIVAKTLQSRLNTKKCTVMLGFTTLICSGIEALGGFLEGKEANKHSFKKFVYRYMHKDYKKRQYKCKRYWELLRENFRNGLVHGFCIKDGGVQGPGRKYFEVIPELGLEIDAWELHRDFQRAFSKYVHDLRTMGEKSGIGQKFNTRFVDVFIKGR